MPWSTWRSWWPGAASGQELLASAGHVPSRSTRALSIIIRCYKLSGERVLDAVDCFGASEMVSSQGRI